MASGNKRMVIGYGQRAVTDDLTRLQDFQSAGAMEAWRYLLNVGRGSDGGGDTIELTVAEAPARAEILGGFMVRPQNGSMSLLVDAGLMFIISPDAAPSTDDSVYKLVKDAGITNVANGLAIGANTSGSVRIDVVEASRVPGVVVESRQEEIFDPISGLFVSTPLPKVVQDGLAYRVRSGVSGGGFPGVAVGWVPLAVVSVPDGARSLDACTLWDVRPLASDRPNLTNRPTAFPRVTRTRLYASPGATAGSLVLQGEVDAQLNDRPVAGSFSAFALTDPANQGGGFSAYASLAHLYLTTPFNLPRWARYTDAGSGGRTPGATLGIPIVTAVAPTAEGAPSSAIALPTATGLQGSAQTTEGVHVASFSPLGLGFATSKAGQRNSTTITVAPTTGSTFDFIPGTHFPANASKLQVQFTIAVESNSNTGGVGCGFRPS